MLPFQKKISDQPQKPSLIKRGLSLTKGITHSGNKEESEEAKKSISNLLKRKNTGKSFNRDHWGFVNIDDPE